MKPSVSLICPVRQGQKTRNTIIFVFIVSTETSCLADPESPDLVRFDRHCNYPPSHFRAINWPHLRHYSTWQACFHGRRVAAVRVIEPLSNAPILAPETSWFQTRRSASRAMAARIQNHITMI
jgi:hypothetical protein